MRKCIFVLMFVLLSASIWAGSLTVSSVSLVDQNSNPIEKDYGEISYRLVGRYMPTSSSIKGQFSISFDSIPYTVGSVPDGDGWELSLYAYDERGVLLGKDELKDFEINGDVNLDAALQMELYSIDISEPTIYSIGEYKEISEYYDVASYVIKARSATTGESVEKEFDVLPAKLSGLSQGVWYISIYALDKEGNSIASKSNIRVYVASGDTPSVEASLIERTPQLRITSDGLDNQRGILYFDQDGFVLNALISPARNDDKAEYSWYVLDENEWKKIGEGESCTFLSADVDALGDDVLIRIDAKIEERVKLSRSFNLHKKPELKPTVFISSNTNAIVGDSGSVRKSIDVSISLPIYYEVAGYSIRYTLNGSKPTLDSECLSKGRATFATLEDGSILSYAVFDNAGNECYFDQIDLKAW